MNLSLTNHFFYLEAYFLFLKFWLIHNIQGIVATFDDGLLLTCLEGSYS